MCIIQYLDDNREHYYLCIQSEHCKYDYMIQRIKKLKNFGIFNDFVATKDLSDFSRFNLFYGWNGSGKTTLSRFFSTLYSKKLPPEFSSADFEILVEGSPSIKQANISAFNSPIFVFNQNFIEENIDWKRNGAKSIIVIAEEKIEERKRYFEIRDKIFPQKKVITESRKTIANATEKEAENFLTDQARGLKNSFQLIDTSDKRYLNYDKGKLRDFIARHGKNIRNQENILTVDTVTKLQQEAKPIEKPTLDYSLPTAALDTYIEALSRVNNLLNASVVNESITRLQDNQDINAWVEKGLHIHEKHESSKCEFCRQELPKEHMNKLRSHFSKAYTELLDKILKACDWVESISFGHNFPEFGELYDELQTEYKEALSLFTECEVNLRKEFEVWSKSLNRKQSRPFDSIPEISDNITKYLTSFLEAARKLEILIISHNQKTTNFKTAVDNVKQKLELHYVSLSLKERDYFKLLDRLESEKKEAESAEAELLLLTEEMNTLEASLANAAKGADDFNKQLHSFLGRQDISLEYDSKEKAYLIMRSKTARAVNLSEGEKTAIAFTYFIAKLRENGNDIKQSIVVVDDPISSFDANHLFHSLACLKANCGAAKQLFVLTHNFTYFKLVREWMVVKAKKNDTNPRHRLFAIEVDKQNPRKARLSNAHNSLSDYGSEYHYLFYRLSAFAEDEKLDLDSSYQVANYSRKLLEAFFSFKHPRVRDNFSQLMEAGCKQGKVDEVLRQKVYKFINTYSHYQVINFGDSPVDNLLSEGENITTDVFDILKLCDPIHFQEMYELCHN